ncbi:unnamed protein product [Urochloa humidicola]
MGKSSLASIAAVGVTLAVFVVGCYGIEVSRNKITPFPSPSPDLSVHVPHILCLDLVLGKAPLSSFSFDPPFPPGASEAAHSSSSSHRLHRRLPRRCCCSGSPSTLGLMDSVFLASVDRFHSIFGSSELESIAGFPSLHQPSPREALPHWEHASVTPLFSLRHGELLGCDDDAVASSSVVTRRVSPEAWSSSTRVCVHVFCEDVFVIQPCQGPGCNAAFIFLIYV